MHTEAKRPVLARAPSLNQVSGFSKKFLPAQTLTTLTLAASEIGVYAVFTEEKMTQQHVRNVCIFPQIQNKSPEIM